MATPANDSWSQNGCGPSVAAPSGCCSPWLLLPLLLDPSVAGPVCCWTRPCWTRLLLDPLLPERLVTYWICCRSLCCWTRMLLDPSVAGPFCSWTRLLLDPSVAGHSVPGPFVAGPPQMFLPLKRDVFSAPHVGRSPVPTLYTRLQSQRGPRPYTSRKAKQRSITARR